MRRLETSWGRINKKALYARFLNVRSHAKYSVFESESITATDKKMFREILNAFLKRYAFRLPLVRGATTHKVTSAPLSV